MPKIRKNARRNSRPATRGRSRQSEVEDASASPNRAEPELSSTPASPPAAPFVLQPSPMDPHASLTGGPSTPLTPGSVSSLSSTTETIASAESITSTETLTPGETIALAETTETSDTANPTGPPSVAPGDESDEEIGALLDAIFQGPPPPLLRPGTTTININGYQYTRSNQTRFRTTYRCSFYRRRGNPCRGKCELLAGTEEYTNFTPHTCNTAAAAAVPERNIRAEMEERVDVIAVTQLEQTANQIWRRINTEFYLGQEGAAVRGLTRDQVMSRVYRARRLHFGGDIHGQIDVPPLDMVQGANLNFFQFHYSYREDGNLHRVIGWAHPALLQLLRYRRTALLIDGTFRCVPAPFTQLVVVMCHDAATNCYVPVFYSLATGRSHTTYWNILHFLIVATDHQLDPESITCDYEAALIAAIRDQLPNVAINGCLFHWKQAIRWRMKKLRIHDTHAGFAMERGAIDMLTVIPDTQVATLGIPYVQQYIQRRCNEERVVYSTAKWASFWSYFDRTWLHTYPVELWNAHAIPLAVINRTNNPLERFNRELNARFPTPHPSLPIFIATIEQISRDRVQFLSDVMAHRARPPRHAAYELPVAVRLT